MGNTSFSHFDAPGMKGLMIKNAQGFSLGTLFKNHHKHPSYNTLQRKKHYPPKPGSAKFRPLAPGLQRHGSDQTPTLLFESKNYVSIHLYNTIYAVEEFLSVIPNSVIL